jgi:hypothetical protein
VELVLSKITVHRTKLPTTRVPHNFFHLFKGLPQSLKCKCLQKRTPLKRILLKRILLKMILLKMILLKIHLLANLVAIVRDNSYHLDKVVIVRDNSYHLDKLVATVGDSKLEEQPFAIL